LLWFGYIQEDMTVVKNLRKLRQDKAWTQRELGQKAGVTQATIVHAEQGGDTRPTTIRKLAEALGVEPRRLMGSRSE
jgi:transcriptional regulator with XRE-family HTH domain